MLHDTLSSDSASPAPPPSWTVSTRNRASSFAALLVVAMVAAGVAAPFLVPRAVLQDLFFILTMLTLAQCWNLLAGYAGLVSVGQQAFVGFGAYVMSAAVILSGLNPVVAIVLGGLAAMMLSVPTAFFVFRLHGAYFAIGTWVIAEVTRLSLAQWKALGGGTGTSLPSGITRDLPGTRLAVEWFGVRPAQAADMVCYWLALLLAFAAIGFAYRLLRSKQGLGLAAVRDNREAARSVGIDPNRIKFAVYLAAAFVTGLTGALIYLQKARISPDAAFSVTDWTAYVIFIVVIGGIGTIEGPIVGVIVFFILQKLFADYGSWYLLVLGLLGIAVMLFAPRGLWGLFAERTGLQLFPVRRILAGGPLTRTIKGGPHG